MEFGPVDRDDAEGAILAHSVRAGSLRLKKGLILDAAHLDALARAGVERITVARLGDADVHEDAAATRLAQALLGASPGSRLRASKAATGRVNLYAESRGVLQIDRAAVNAVNVVDPAITVATVPEWQHMDPGGMVATIKIIAYGVDETALRRAERAAAAALRIVPTALGSAALIQTVVPPDDGARGHQAIASRMQALGIAMGPKAVIPHDESALAEALGRARADLILILTASATSDIHDVAPEAVRRAGGRVLHYGMPVDPGNLLFIGDLDGRPVIGLPGCARSPARNGADWVLERVACGVGVSAQDIMGLGVGGLLKEIPSRGRPREQT